MNAARCLKHAPYAMYDGHGYDGEWQSPFFLDSKRCCLIGMSLSLTNQTDVRQDEEKKVLDHKDVS